MPRSGFEPASTEDQHATYGLLSCLSGLKESYLTKIAGMNYVVELSVEHGD